MKATLEHRIMWFLLAVNPQLNGIRIVHVKDPNVGRFVKFEVILTTDHITAFWSPTEKALSLIKEPFELNFEVDFEKVDFNNTKTTFWFNPSDSTGEYM